jgi:hypothetical protein
MSRSKVLPPYDVVSVGHGFALLIELPGCPNPEVSLTSPSTIRVTGLKDTRPPLAAYTGHLHVGRQSGRFIYDFEVPPFHEIETSDQIEVEYLHDQGALMLVVRKKDPCP